MPVTDPPGLTWLSAFSKAKESTMEHWNQRKGEKFTGTAYCYEGDITGKPVRLTVKGGVVIRIEEWHQKEPRLLAYDRINDELVRGPQQ